jgi:hypothetical protein
MPGIPQLSAAKVSNPKFGEKVRNSPDISKGIFHLGICKFESSQVSQPVRRPETLPSTMPQRPANGGLLRIGYRSPGSGIGVSGSEIADSLRRIFEIFPFSGDWGRRPGSICTAWPSLQCHPLKSPPWPPASWECPAHTAGSSSQRNCPILCLPPGQLGAEPALPRASTY